MAKYPIATRGAILAAQDLKREMVDVDEWQCSVIVRTLTGTERDAFHASLLVNGKVTREQQTAKFLALCIVGDDGKALFGEDDVPALGAKSTVALQRISEIADRLNSVNAAAVEESVKNSSSGPSAGSSSDGPSRSAASPESSSPQ